MAIKTTIVANLHLLPDLAFLPNQGHYMFNSITVSGVTYNLRSAGVYMRAGSTLGSPTDELRLRRNSSVKNPSISVTKYFHHVEPATSTQAEKRFPVSITTQIQLPPGVPGLTPSMLEAKVAELGLFFTEDSINRMFLGED